MKTMMNMAGMIKLQRTLAMNWGILGGLILLTTVSCVKDQYEAARFNVDNQVYYATIEESETSGTRVFMGDDHRVLWDSLDVIDVFPKGNAWCTYRYSGATGTNTGEFLKFSQSNSDTPVEFEYIYAVYSRINRERMMTEGVIPVYLSDTQDYQEGSFGKWANIMVSCGTTNELFFKNVCGYLKLRLYGDNINVGRIEFEGNDGEFLTGYANVSVSPDSDPVLTFDTSNNRKPGKKITQRINGGVMLGSTPETATEFWFVLPPITFKKGFRITVYGYEDTTQARFIKTASLPFSIERNRIKKMAPLQVVPNYYYCVPEAIDLGLSVKWASFDLGSSDPWSAGYFYSWGDFDPRKKGYYKWGTISQEGLDTLCLLTKYCTVPEYGENGLVDMKTVLDPQDDPATVYLGEEWRTPTDAEWRELMAKCSSSTSYCVKSNVPGYTDKELYLDDNRYWSSTLDESHPARAYVFGYDDMDVYQFKRYSEDRYMGPGNNGALIRAVQGKEVKTLVSGVSLSQQSFKMSVGEEGEVQAFVTPAWANDISLTWSVSDPSVVEIIDNGMGMTLDGYRVSFKALKFGEATITATTRDGLYSARCSVTVTCEQPEMVDLGLSVKWANMDLGAIKPSEIGNCFPWGSLTPMDRCSWSNYPLCEGTDNTLTKYNSDPSYGAVDHKLMLDLEDDVARSILGGEWRMPTLEEFNELIENCTVEETQMDGIDGYLFTSKVDGYSDRSVFFPKSNSTRSRWTANVCSPILQNQCSLSSYPIPGIQAYYINIALQSISQSYRTLCLPIRPVCGRDPHNISISINASELEMEELTERQMSSSISPEDMSGLDVYWASSNPSVARISPDGLITAIGKGDATVTAYAPTGACATCSVKVTSVPYVDLGLSVRWASKNLGAESPLDIGDHFAWAEHAPKEEFKMNNYLWAGSGIPLEGLYSWNLTKYFYDGKNFSTRVNLDKRDDAAYLILGTGWAMPHENDWLELANDCVWQYVSLDAEGNEWAIKISGKKDGFTERFIFLPMGGYLDSSSGETEIQEGWGYWSKTLCYSNLTSGYWYTKQDCRKALSLCLLYNQTNIENRVNDSSGVFTYIPIQGRARYLGLCIRPVL